MVLKLVHKINNDIVYIILEDEIIYVKSDNVILKEGFLDLFYNTITCNSNNLDKSLSKFVTNKTIKLSDEYLNKIFIPEYSQFYRIFIGEEV